MQDGRDWKTPVGALGRLTAAAYERASQLTPRIAELRARALDTPSPPSFADALRAGDGVAIIAEIKRRSPSRGPINEAIRSVPQATAYVAGGAAAISVLTESSEFGGESGDLREIADAVSVPVLKKDFHVAESQVWEARGLGASAMLFIVRALAPGQLERLVDTALRAGVAPFAEVRTPGEMARAIATPAVAIGVNARDLETLFIEDAVVERLLPLIPPGRIAVAESGLSFRVDVERVAMAGADAVLIGSVLSSSPDPAGAVRAMTGVARRGRLD